MLNRRELLATLTATGIGTATFRAAAAVGSDELTRDSLLQAAWITEYQLTDDETDRILDAVANQQQKISALRKIELESAIPPAFRFQTLAPPQANPAINRNVTPINVAAAVELPASDGQIALLSLVHLSHLIRTRKLTSRRLTEIYLNRLKRFGPMLRCVVNLTEALAFRQADAADTEIAAGKYRGPLHGIPWGAKDLIAVPGYPTTWGIPHFKHRELDVESTVYKRLTAAGAVLVAKLSLGAIAMGDQWYEGRTRSPWNPRSGSSGSSAGSASATVAGLVGFSLGTETLGSITSPSRVCGASGFRPTFGRVSRFGCMALSWTMDKVGPICREPEDCAIVFAAIHGADRLDPTATDAAFDWPAPIDPTGLKIGVMPGMDIEKQPELKQLDEMGCKLIEAHVPNDLPVRSLASIIDIEAAAGFDQLLRDGHTAGWNSWTNIFRTAQYVSAIDYIRMMRLRTRLLHDFEEFIAPFDFLFNVFDVFHTNLTGHPSVVIPRGQKVLESGGRRPATVGITGHLNQDQRLLAFAVAYRNAGPVRENPELEQWLERYEAGELDRKRPATPAKKSDSDPGSSDGK